MKSIGIKNYTKTELLEQLYFISPNTVCADLFIFNQKPPPIGDGFLKFYYIVCLQE